MKVTFPIYYTESYIPKKCRKYRENCVKGETTVNIAEVNISDKNFPVAFIVKKYDWRYEEGASDVIFDILPKEVRVYKSGLYSRVRASDFRSHAEGWATFENLITHLTPNIPWEFSGNPTPSDARDVVSNKKEKFSCLKSSAKKWLIVNNDETGVLEVWRKTTEPMYEIITFGLGHNHASTTFSIVNGYNSNLSRKAYFTALQRDEMIKACVEKAIRRGDTNSVPRIKESEETIEVLMPEMVKRNPNKEYGDGEPFHNMLEAITETSESIGEAAALAIATTIIETSKN